MSAKNWPLAFSFVFPSRTVDIEFASGPTAPADTKLKLRYFKAIVQDAKEKSMRALLEADEEVLLSPAATPSKNGHHVL